MAEAAPIEDDVKKKAPLRPPNRRRHDEQIEQIMQTIRNLEVELRSYGRPQQVDESSGDGEPRDVILAEQKRLREEKEAYISKRKDLDDGLKVINEQISKQSDALSKLDAGLAFKTEPAFDDAIRNLEYQLTTRHFKVSEENRIVKEIDSLRRSKKKVKEYLQQKQQIDAQKAKKNAMKDERNKFFRLVSSLKGKEDELKKQLMKVKSKTDEAWTRYREAGPRREALKKEIDECYERRRQLTSEFRQQNSKYHMQQKQNRADSFRRREEEKRSLEQFRKKQWQDYEASREPYEDERQLCSALIRYLQRYLTPEQDLPLGASALSPVQSPTSSASSPVTGKDEDTEYVILKKKTDDGEDVFLPATSAKKKRAIRKHNRKSSWLSKPIRHTAQIFSQFESLGLRAPVMMSEVPDSIEQITAKKGEYEVACKETRLSNQMPLGAAATQSEDPSSALDPNVASVPDLPSSQHSLVNSELDDTDSDSMHFKLKTIDDKLPRIDIHSARSAQQLTNSNPGAESAPETPNSEGSVPREGDLESVDSGIGIHRLKVSSTAPCQDIGCTDTIAKTCKQENDHQVPDLPSPTVNTCTQDALLQTQDPLAGYLDREVVSILADKPAQFSHDNDHILEDTTL